MDLRLKNKARWLLPVVVSLATGCSALGTKPADEDMASSEDISNLDVAAEVSSVTPEGVPAVAQVAAQPGMVIAGAPANGYWQHTFNPLVPVVQNMLTQMEFNNQEVSGATRIAVTSFSDLNTLAKTDSLGRQLSETFSHELHQRGFSVVEHKATGTIKVTPQGDFALSRNLDDLSRNLVVEYVLSGTISQQYNGLVINARLINLSSKLVAASAQGFIPAEQMRDMMRHGRLFRVQEGMLIRDNTLSMRPISLR